MVEFVLLCAAAISIAVTVFLHNKCRFAPLVARVRKRQPWFRLGATVNWRGAVAGAGDAGEGW